jgi:hypothetical protein
MFENFQQLLEEVKKNATEEIEKKEIKIKDEIFIIEKIIVFENFKNYRIFQKNNPNNFISFNFYFGKEILRDIIIEKNGKVFYYENKKDKLSFKEKFHGYTIEGFKKWLNRGKILNKELINKVLENVNDFYGNLEKNK